MFKSELLQEILTLEQRKRGYSLAKDEHFVYILFEDKMVARFNATKATKDEVRRIVNNLIAETE